MNLNEAIQMARNEALKWDKTFFVLREGTEFLVSTSPHVEGTAVVTKFAGIAEAMFVSESEDEDEDGDEAEYRPQADDRDLDDYDPDDPPRKPSPVMAVSLDDDGNVVDEWTWDDEVGARMAMFGADTEEEMWEAYENWSDRD